MHPPNRETRLAPAAAISEAWVWLVLVLFIAIRIVGSHTGRDFLSALVGR